MPRETRTVRVEEIPGEPFCFRVESWTKAQQPHRVELLEHDGFGACSCKNWITKKWPVIRDKKAPIRCTDLTECRHVKVARIKVDNRLYRDLSRQHQPATAAR